MLNPEISTSRQNDFVCKCLQQLEDNDLFIIHVAGLKRLSE